MAVIRTVLPVDRPNGQYLNIDFDQKNLVELKKKLSLHKSKALKEYAQNQAHLQQRLSILMFYLLKNELRENTEVSTDTPLVIENLSIKNGLVIQFKYGNNQSRTKTIERHKLAKWLEYSNEKAQYITQQIIKADTNDNFPKFVFSDLNTQHNKKARQLRIPVRSIRNTLSWHQDSYTSGLKNLKKDYKQKQQKANFLVGYVRKQQHLEARILKKRLEIARDNQERIKILNGFLKDYSWGWLPRLVKDDLYNWAKNSLNELKLKPVSNVPENYTPKTTPETTPVRTNSTSTQESNEDYYSSESDNSTDTTPNQSPRRTPSPDREIIIDSVVGKEKPIELYHKCFDKIKAKCDTIKASTENTINEANTKIANIKNLGETEVANWLTSDFYPKLETLKTEISSQIDNFKSDIQQHYEKLSESEKTKYMGTHAGFNLASLENYLNKLDKSTYEIAYKNKIQQLQKAATEDAKHIYAYTDESRKTILNQVTSHPTLAGRHALREQSQTTLKKIQPKRLSSEISQSSYDIRLTNQRDNFDRVNKLKQINNLLGYFTVNKPMINLIAKKVGDISWLAKTPEERNELLNYSHPDFVNLLVSLQELTSFIAQGHQLLDENQDKTIHEKYFQELFVNLNYSIQGIQSTKSAEANKLINDLDRFKNNIQTLSTDGFEEYLKQLEQDITQIKNNIATENNGLLHHNKLYMNDVEEFAPDSHIQDLQQRTYDLLFEEYQTSKQWSGWIDELNHLFRDKKFDEGFDMLMDIALKQVIKAAGGYKTTADIATQKPIRYSMSSKANQLQPSEKPVSIDELANELLALTGVELSPLADSNKQVKDLPKKKEIIFKKVNKLWQSLQDAKPESNMLIALVQHRMEQLYRAANSNLYGAKGNEVLKACSPLTILDFLEPRDEDNHRPEQLQRLIERHNDIIQRSSLTKAQKQKALINDIRPRIQSQPIPSATCARQRREFATAPEAFQRLVSAR